MTTARATLLGLVSGYLLAWGAAFCVLVGELQLLGHYLLLSWTGGGERVAFVQVFGLVGAGCGGLAALVWSLGHRQREATRVLPPGDPLDAVRTVLRAERAGTLTGQALITECTHLARALQNTGTEIPETVWHYLIDADIRVRDTEFATAQRDGVEQILKQQL